MIDSIYTWCGKASSYIKFKKDREEVYEKLVSEMETYIKELKQSGMDDQEAMRKAIMDMGDADEVGRKLRKSHNPCIGWIWLISKWLMIGSILFFFVTMLNGGNVYRTFQYYYNQNSSWIEEYYQNSEDGRCRVITFSSEQKAKFNGYQFSLKRAAIHLNDNQDRYVYFCIHTSYLIGKRPPDGIRYYMTAVDSNGNEYGNILNRMQSRGVAGNSENVKLTSCDYEMWISNVDTTATWIDICYEGFGHAFRFRIPLE